MPFTKQENGIIVTVIDILKWDDRDFGSWEENKARYLKKCLCVSAYRENPFLKFLGLRKASIILLFIGLILIEVYKHPLIER